MGQYECELCCFKTGRIDAYNIHLTRRKHINRKKDNSQCDNSAESKIPRRLTESHGEFQTDVNNNGKKVSLECSHCFRAYSRQSDLTKHLKSCTEKMIYEREKLMKEKLELELEKCVMKEKYEKQMMKKEIIFEYEKMEMEKCVMEAKYEKIIMGQKIEFLEKEKELIASHMKDKVDILTKQSEGSEYMAKKSMSALKYAIKNFKNANTISADVLLFVKNDISNQDLEALEEMLIYQQSHNNLAKYIADHFTKHLNVGVDKRSFHNSDTARLTFIVNEDQWQWDKKGRIIDAKLIQPVLENLKPIVSNYLPKVHKRILSGTLTTAQTTFLLEKQQIMDEIRSDILDNTLASAILRHLAPDFYLDIGKTE